METMTLNLKTLQAERHGALTFVWKLSLIGIELNDWEVDSFDSYLRGMNILFESQKVIQLLFDELYVEKNKTKTNNDQVTDRSKQTSTSTK